MSRSSARWALPRLYQRRPQGSMRPPEPRADGRRGEVRDGALERRNAFGGKRAAGQRAEFFGKPRRIDGRGLALLLEPPAVPEHELEPRREPRERRIDHVLRRAGERSDVRTPPILGR